MRKRIVRLMAIAAILALLPAMALADRFAVVKGGRLNLRAYPSANSQSLGKYNTGTWVIAGTDSNGWCSVQTLDGKRGYMSSNYLNFGMYSGGATVKYASGGYVNLRSGPSTENSVVMRVPTGTTVYIQGNYNGWCYLHVMNGSTPVYGYMYETFINTGTANARVTTKNGGKVNVRSGPGSGYKSIGSLPTGTQVSVLLSGSGWAMISGGGLEGFMSESYLSTSGSSSGSGSSGGTTTAVTAYVNNPKSTQVLNLRETPSQNGRSIGQYRNGTKVKVVSKGSTWCEVYVGTRHGYMMTKYLSFSGSYIEPSVPAYPSYPTYPTYTAAPVYPVYPTVTPTPTPLVQYITPVPQLGTGLVQPKAGDTVTLTFSSGGGNTINVYNDPSLTALKAAYTGNKQAMMLQYGENVCMVYVDGGVAYVSTWNVNY